MFVTDVEAQAQILEGRPFKKLSIPGLSEGEMTLLGNARTYLNAMQWQDLVTVDSAGRTMKHWGGTVNASVHPQLFGTRGTRGESRVRLKSVATNKLTQYHRYKWDPCSHLRLQRKGMLEPQETGQMFLLLLTLLFPRFPRFRFGCAEALLHAGVMSSISSQTSVPAPSARGSDGTETRDLRDADGSSTFVCQTRMSSVLPDEVADASVKSRTEVMVDTPFLFRFRVLEESFWMGPRFNMAKRRE